MNISLTVFKFIEKTQSAYEKFQSGIFCKNIGGVMVLFFCTSSDDASHLYQVSLKYLDSIKEIFIRKNSKGHNSAKLVGGDTVLVLCTLSDGGLYLFKVSSKYL